uniref:Uncharacterized protein n=1 Tax=Odontella aurita TaxID=265563 RepID=A0A7S4MG38_9STRA
MGRVARYKKVKSFDPFSSNSRQTGHIYGGAGGSGVGNDKVIWGTAGNGRKAKKRSKTAAKLRETKLKRRARRGKGGGGDAFEEADDGGFDLPPGKDDFDMRDLVGSLKKSRKPRRSDGLLDDPLENNEGGRKAAGVKPSKPLKEGVVVDVAAAHEASSSSSASDDVVVPTVPKATIPQNEREERAMRRLAGLSERAVHDPSAAAAAIPGAAAPRKPAVEPRRPGESLKNFCRRVDRESWKVIERQNEESRLLVENDKHGNSSRKGRRAPVVNPERKAKKKEFLKDQKAKKREGTKRHLEMQRRMEEGGNAGGGDSGDDSDGGGGGFVTGEMAAAVQARASASASTLASVVPTTGAASLHDRVERPPEFRHVPRGAERKKVVIPDALADGEGDDNPSSSKKKRRKRKGGGGGGMDEEEIEREQKRMEIMRKKVQEQYRQMKARKRKEGEHFHM